MLHIHHNIPGVLRRVNDVIADRGINVLGQHLQTAGDLGYVVFDVDAVRDVGMLHELRAIEGTIRARVLY